MNICVCGAGTMGTGIAQVSASSGYKTIIYDLNEDVLQRSRQSLERALDSLVTKQKLAAEERQSILSRIHFTNELSDCVADVIIEAVIERIDVKVDLFNRLAAINGEKTIFASNTSSLSVTEIAKNIKGPERVAGLHFFNPAPLMKLVEVVQAEATEPEVIQQLVSFTRSLKKHPVVCKDSPGFIVNRVARPYYIESLRLAEEGAISYEDIDAALESRGFRMGPFHLMDLIGNDINYAVSCSVYQQLGEPERLKPSYLQKEKVEQGELGRKTGKGYFSY